VALSTDSNCVAGFVPFGSPIVSIWVDLKCSVLVFALV